MTDATTDNTIRMYFTVELINVFSSKIGKKASAAEVNLQKTRGRLLQIRNKAALRVNIKKVPPDLPSKIPRARSLIFPIATPRFVYSLPGH